MATAQTSRAQHSYAPRHHPYAPPASRVGPSWQIQEPKAREYTERRQVCEPPSPPQSRREQSETPSLGLGVAFGASSGGKWWDEELPAPPSSLTSILESFRRSGEGDRELLLSILGAKKAEEERLTALIQTRLTILQARLSLHATAASLASPAPVPRPDVPMSIMPERTPSLGASSRGSSSSSTGPASPLEPPVKSLPAQLASEKSDKGFFTLPPPSSMLRRRSRSPSPIDRRARPYHLPANHPRRSLSPKSSHVDGRAPGLDMLLDAGMESERRDGGERK